MKRLFFLMVISSALIFNAHGQGFWTGLNGPFGGEVEDIIYLGTGTMLSATNGGLYRSTDDGSSWTRIKTGFDQFDYSLRDIEVDGAGKIYCISYNHLYTSINDGLTWTKTNTTGFGDGRKIKIAGDGDIYVSTYNSLLKSSNNGSTFANTTYVTENEITGLEVSSSSPELVFVARRGMTIKKGTNGTSWSDVSSTGFPTINGGHEYRIAMDKASPNNLYALTEVGPYKIPSSGSTWSSVKNNLTETNFYGNIFYGADNLFLFNSDVNKSFISTDGGSTWATPGNDYIFPGIYIPSFAAKSATEIFKVVSTYGVYKSTNSGASWEGANNGIKSFNPRGIIVTPGQNRLLMPGNDRGYQFSIDDGNSWDLVNTGTPNRYIRGLLVLDDNSLIAHGDGLIRSTNEGDSWTVENTGGFYDMMASSGNDLYTVAGTNLLKSTDYGANWTTTAITGISGNHDKILVDDLGNVYLKDWSDSRVYKIPNGSSNAVQLTPNTYDYTLADNTILILSSPTTLEISVDGGTVFNQTSWGSSFAATKIWAYSENDFFTMSNQNGKLNISSDAGVTWDSQSLLDTDAFVNDLTWRKDGIDLFLYLAPNTSVTHRSTNGVIKPKAPSNLEIKGIAFNGATIAWEYDIVNFNTETFEIETSIGNNFSWDEYTSIGFLYENNQGIWDASIGGDPSTQVYVRVKATNSAGSSAYSNEVVINFPPNCTSDVPDNRSWTGVATADPGSTAPGGAGPFTSPNVAIKVVSGNPNTFRVENYTFGINNDNIGVTIDENCGETYFSQNGYHMANGNGTWNPGTGKLILKWESTGFYDFFEGTTEFTLNAVDPVPDVPEIQVYLYSSTEAFINWSQTNFTTNFILERSPSPGGPFIEVANLAYPTVFYLDKNLTTGNTYYYRLKGSNGSGTSAPSVEKSITLQPVLFRPEENDISLNFENQQGVSWGDLDGDGLEDIASPSFTNREGDAVPPVFFKNLGGGAFEKKVITALVNENTGVSRGINLMDYNNDDKLDMYITRSGGGLTDLLLLNNGNWDFTKIVVPTTANYATGFRSSANIDFDNDGFVDVIVGQDGNQVPPNLRDLLLKNVQGTGFSEVLTGDLVTLSGNSRNLNTVDYNNDGLTDIFVVNYSNDPGGARLFKNNGDGTFSKVNGSIFDSQIFYSIRTSSWGDIDNDGDMDLFMGSLIVNAITPNRLLQNNGDGTFTELTSSAVAETTGRTYGSAFGDLDNDGDLDLIAVNGSGVDNSNSIFFNNGSGVFTKYVEAEMINHPEIQNIGVGLADYDQDGFLDIYPAKGITTTVDIPNLLYRNTNSNGGSRNWIQFKLVGTESNRSAIGARITVATSNPLRSQIREISTRTGYGSANSLTAHFGLGTSLVADEVEIKWPSGNVMVLNNLPINQIHTITEDVTGPALSLNPTAGSNSVPVGNTITITLDEEGSGVSGKFIRIRKGSETATPFQSLSATAGVKEGMTFTYTLAATTDYQTTYFVSIDEGAFIDQYQNGSLAVAPIEWTFTTEEPPDLTFPVITFNPNDYISLPKGFGSDEKLVAIASDNKAVTSFSMFYRKVTATQYSQVFGSLTSGSSYEFPLLESFFDDMGMEFYLEAKDAAGNTTLSPASGNHRILLEFDDSNTTLSVASGAGVNNYQIRSVPFENLPSNEISVLFDELGQPDGTQYRILRYKNNPESWLEYPNGFNAVARGEGYFMLVRDGANIKFGSAKAPTNSQENLFVINLIAGWNLIGNPYTVTASWNESITGLSGVGGLKVYQNGAYVDGDEMPIFNGGFVFADVAQPVAVKLKTSATGGRKKSDFSNELDKPSWVVPIQLEQGGSVFSLGAVGMHPDSKVSYDQYDDLTPPALSERLELAFKHPEHFMKVFSKDILPTSESGEWEFSIISDKKGLATLSWEPNVFGENSRELMLYDLELQKIVDMRGINAYTFDPNVSTGFKLYYGENLEKKIMPSGVSLGNPVPNPANRTSSISFTLSDQEPEYQVALEVYDMMGKPIDQIVAGKLKPGFYTYQWNLDNQSVSNGLYTYRLAVSSNGNRVIKTRKVIVNK
ncbi:MAG: FG-GAP-like repeat-containing protein [Cyclobacteriaceae bacterium]